MVTFDLASLTARLGELEEELAKPDFWNDQQRAAKLSAEHTRVQRKLHRYEQLQSNVAFLQEGVGTFQDEDLLPVAPRRAARARSLQEDALFSGEYDAGDAVVTIQADAGGTDAQDWAEMLLRMYLRWAERRGFKTEVLETSPGEEYGIKSATFTVKGENAYGILKAERGKHRLVRLSPVRLRAPPPHELRADHRRAPAPDDAAGSRSTTTTSASTRSARPAPAAST